MVLNETFQTVVNNAGGQVLNYDYVDVAAGTGFVDYYLGTTFSNSTSGALLSNQTFYSNQVTTFKNLVADTTWALANDVDFDIKFNKSQVIKGTAIINVPMGIKENADSAYLSYIHARIRKWDGNNESEIADASGAILSKSTGGVNTYGYTVSAIDVVVPETTFRVGESLRVTIEQYGLCAAGPNNSWFFFGHSPQNRATITGDEITWGTEPSIATIKIPYRLDLS